MRLVQHEFELTRFARGEQYQVAALVASAARASAAVDEGFEVLRQAVLYNVADGVDVEAAGRDVGRHEYGDAAAAQRRERVVALALAHVAVYRRRAETYVAEAVRYILRLGARSAEEQRFARVLPYQDVDEPFKALARRDDIGLLRYVAVRGDVGDERDFFRRVEVELRQREHLGRHRRGEEPRALDVVHRLKNGLHLVVEAHVEHVVAFVKYHARDVFGLERAATQVVEDSPRRADDDGSAVAQRTYLPLHVEAADERRNADAHVRAEPGEFARRLLRELARRRKHDYARRAGPSLHLVEQRQSEGERLAAAGARLHYEVVAGEALVAQDGGLHRHRVLEALALYRAQQLRPQIEICESFLKFLH